MELSAAFDSRALREVRDFLSQLRPAWWVLRGYLLVLLPAVRHVNGTRDFPIPAVMGRNLIGGVVVLFAIAASIAVGRRRSLPRPATVGVVALNGALVLGALGALSDARWRLTEYRSYSTGSTDPFAQSPVVSRSGPITNIYPYAADGTPLQDVLLFDQDGRPLATGTQRWFVDGCRRLPVPPLAADGVPVPFSYPKAYVLDPTGVTRYGTPAAPEQCGAQVQGPQVPLPTFAPRPAQAPAASPSG